MSTGALSGIVVADFTRILAGPFATMTLGDLGAQIVKIERPDGDDTRKWGPPRLDGDSTYYLGVNRNKRSIVLDLRDPADLDVARALAGNADVVVENFRPGTMARYGLDEASLRTENPGLVYCSISAFGPGAGAELAGYDLLVQALGGLMSITGPNENEPTKVGVAVVDVLAGLFATVGILAALRTRESTGLGQRVEVNLLSALLSALANQSAAYVLTGSVPKAMGNAHPSIAPYDTFATAAGTLVLAVGTDAQFQKLCSVLGIPEILSDYRFNSNDQRVRNKQELRNELERALAGDSADNWCCLLTPVGVPAGVVNSIEAAFSLADTLGLDPIRQADDDHGPHGRQIGSPIGLSRTPVSYRMRAPDLGQHDREVREWINSLTTRRKSA